MNQHPPYVGQYPPPQQPAYRYPYPPTGQGQPPYQFDPHAIAQAQQLYNRSYQTTPVQGQQPGQVPQQQQQSQPSSSRPRSQNQGLITFQLNNSNNEQSSNGGPSNDGPTNDPGAPAPAAESGEEDEDDQDQTQVNDEQPIYHIPPPPENTYPSEPEMEKAMHAWCLEQGYEMVRRASKKNARGILYKRYYHCSRHGTRLNTQKIPLDQRQRQNRKSQRTGCPMSIACVSVDPNNPQGEWQIRHRKTHHNHPPMEAITLAGHRRRARTGGVEKAVDGLFAIGSSTAQVLKFLQTTHKDGLYTRTDVANMKMKYKKHGTCADRQISFRMSRDSAVRAGITHVCDHCRENRKLCTAERPSCRPCIESGNTCVYTDHPDPLDAMDEDGGEMVDGENRQADPAAAASTQTDTQAASQYPPQPATQRPLPNLSALRPSDRRQATEHILANLRSFQAEHITPTRLTLTSSSVEVLAASSCGTGASFTSVPILFDAADWPTYREAMLAAARKENTHDVLSGEKPEPAHPGTSVDLPVEDWNEYIRQQAIFNRRNAAQLAGLWDRLSPSFRHRIKGATKAAAAWATLEEVCQPRGSQQAFQLYRDLHSITLETCRDNLHDYISRVTATYEQFSLLKVNYSPPSSIRPVKEGTGSSVRTGGEAVPEEMVCFLFLRGLGEGWAKWVEGLVATNNIGGFGTGERLGLRELGKRALGYRAMQRLG